MEEHRRPARVARVIAAVAVAASFVVGPIHSVSSQVALPGGTTEARGMGITRPGIDLNKTLGDLNQMRRSGVNSVMIDVWWDVNDEQSVTMQPGSITASDDLLLKAIQQSKAAGMRVDFMPKLWCPNCSHTWRGILQPTPRNAFYDNYRAFVDKYADLARTGGADLFVIGSEMNSTQNDDLQDGQGPGAPWRKVAEEAKQHFGGRITYDANWDTVNDVKFWDAVDLISVSAYYPLLNDEKPSVSQIKSAWRSTQAELYPSHDRVSELQVLATRTGKQILFGEVGYLSSTRAGQRPYDPSNQQEYSDAVQTNFYQALLETFQGQTWWAGAFWWEWYQDDGPKMSYTPRDKMTEQFLKAWYVDGWRGGEYSSTVAASTTTTTTPQGATTTTTGPYKHPPPNSAPIPNGPAPYSPPPPQSTGPPPTQPRQQAPPPPNPPPQYPPPQYPPPQYAPPPTSPPPTAPAYIPNSAPVISGDPSTTRPTLGRATATTVPPTTTTAVPHKEAVVVPSNAGLPPTPPLFSPRPVVARTYDGGVRPSRGRALMLGGLAIFLPMIGALLALVAIQQHEERMRRASFSAARLYAWQHVGEPQLARAPAVRRPPRPRSSRATWPARQPWPHRAAHRRPGGLRQWFRGR